MSAQTDYTTPPPPPPVLPPPTSDSIVPLGLLNNDTNPPPSWVISTFGPGGTGVPPYLVVSVSSHKDGIHPGWLQNLIDNYSSGDSSGATPLSLPMWLLSIVEYQDYLEFTPEIDEVDDTTTTSLETSSLVAEDSNMVMYVAIGAVVLVAGYLLITRKPAKR